MRRYSPPYYSFPRRGYVGRGRSPSRRGYGGGGGGYGRREEQNNGSLLVRNIPLDCRPEELRIPYERFGLVRDVYIPKDYYTGEPRGFAFVQFVDPYDAAEAQCHMNGKRFAGREIFVVVAAERRKRPEEMRQRARFSGGSGYDRPQSSYYGHSRPYSISCSRSPRLPQGSRGRYRSRFYSPVPRQHEHYPVLPRRRHAEHPRSPRGPPQVQGFEYTRQSYSPAYDDAADRNHSNDYGKGKTLKSEGSGAHWRSPPGREALRSPSGSRSRSADLSPRQLKI